MRFNNIVCLSTFYMALKMKSFDALSDFLFLSANSRLLCFTQFTDFLVAIRFSFKWIHSFGIRVEKKHKQISKANDDGSIKIRIRADYPQNKKYMTQNVFRFSLHRFWAAICKNFVALFHREKKRG